MLPAASLGGGQVEVGIVDSELDPGGDIGAKEGVQEFSKLERAIRHEQQGSLCSVSWKCFV